MSYNTNIHDIVQFRLVLLNDDDSVKEILYISKEYVPCNCLTGSFADDMYKCLMTFDKTYNFSDWEKCPPMEFQCRRKGWDEWQYYSDPIDDYMNL